MALVFKFSHHRHTGRLLPHEHTSFAALFFALLLVGIGLVVYSAGTLADTGNLTITALVPGPPITQGAVITSPVNGQHFSSIPVKVEGTCPAGVVVKIFKNNVLAGTAFCQSNNLFSLQIDLFPGQNELVAHDYDAFGHVGPDTGSIFVYYDVPATVIGPSGGLISELFIKTDSGIFRGIIAGQTLTWPFEIVGGVGPYAVSINWGDGKVTLLSQAKAGKFNAEHVYALGGNYTVTVQATDSLGSSAYLQVVAVVGGAVGNVTATTKPTSFERGSLAVAWPMYALALFMVTSFWLGDRYEKEHLEKLGYKPAAFPKKA